VFFFLGGPHPPPNTLPHPSRIFLGKENPNNFYRVFSFIFLLFVT